MAGPQETKDAVFLTVQRSDGSDSVMRPGYVAMLFLLIGLILFGFARYKPGRDNGPTEISRRIRQRTGVIFLAVATMLLIFDVITHSDLQ